jgi:hypothetical protein
VKARYLPTAISAHLEPQDRLVADIDGGDLGPRIEIEDGSEIIVSWTLDLSRFLGCSAEGRKAEDGVFWKERRIAFAAHSCRLPLHDSACC